MCPTNERRRYFVTSSLIGWAHTQNNPYGLASFGIKTWTGSKVEADQVETHFMPNKQINGLVQERHNSSALAMMCQKKKS